MDRPVPGYPDDATVYLVVNDSLSEDTKRFIDRHGSAGEKRPPAPSVRRETESNQAARKTRA